MALRCMVDAGQPVTGADGCLAFRGFYGSYEVRVRGAGGREIVREVRLTKSGPAGAVQLTE
ncbi:MAG: hypothetical protein ABSH46_15685 [Bryobacteraceae bacterium]